MKNRTLWASLALFPMVFACTGEDEAPAPADVEEVECRVDLDCNRCSPNSDCAGGSLQPGEDASYRYCDLGIAETDFDNRCTTCLAAASRSGTTIDVGCARGEECIGSRCVAVEATCANEDPSDGNEELECPEGRRHCVLGQCIECETASNCPFFGVEDTCFAVRCNLGWCSAENVCTCESSVECNDGEDCTTDVCSADTQECVHTVRAGCGTAEAPPAGGGGGGSAPPPAETGSLTLNWSPASGTFASATISASVAGGPMTPRATQANATTISTTLPAVTRGSTVDTSVEFTQGGQTSFSCVMSGGTMTPVGTLSAAATTGTPAAFTQVPNGLGGCNRRTTMP